MTGMVTAVQEALRAWNERGRLADLVAPLLRWLLVDLEAERAFFFTVTADGGYRIRSSRNRDRETIPDAERWISHFVVQRALGDAQPCYFSDTRHDRRFRTEAEAEGGVRTRSILAIPVQGGDVDALLYFDSRFSPMSWQEHVEEPRKQQLAVIGQAILAGLLRETSDAERRQLARQVKRLERAVKAVPEPPPAVSIPSGNLREVDFHGFRTRCPELIASIDELRRLAPAKLSIFIEGESGTGKEVLARAIHAESRRSGPFLSLHCGAIPTSLVEVELFGHEEGAFTGAERARRGLFQQADGGSILLDDVEEMSHEMQLALLRVLETGTFRPLSGAVELTADVRVMSTSQLSLRDKALLEELREDLYYRLAGATIRIPPLRYRREDVLLLAHLFALRENGGHGFSIAPAAESAMLSYEWPGNVRELLNLIRRVIALGERQLTASRFQDVTGEGAVAARQREAAGTDMQSVVDRAEREAIIRALVQSGGNKSRACRALGLSRKTLYRRMEKHGIPL